MRVNDSVRTTIPKHIATFLIIPLLVVFTIMITPAYATNESSYQYGFNIGKQQGLLADWADGIAGNCDSINTTLFTMQQANDCGKGFYDGWNAFCHVGFRLHPENIEPYVTCPSHS